MGEVLSSPLPPYARARDARYAQLRPPSTRLGYVRVFVCGIVFIALNRSELNPLPPSDAVRKQKKIEVLWKSLLSQFEKYHPSRNLKFDNLGIFLSLKFRFSMENMLTISQANFTPNTLGCYALISCCLEDILYIVNLRCRIFSLFHHWSSIRG